MSITGTSFCITLSSPFIVVFRGGCAYKLLFIEPRNEKYVAANLLGFSNPNSGCDSVQSTKFFSSYPALSALFVIDVVYHLFTMYSSSKKRELIFIIQFFSLMMPPPLPISIFHYFLCSVGTIVNVLLIFIILRKTPRSLR